MLKPLFVALFAISFAIPLTAQSPGFDCAKATTPQEKAICASPELSKADADMTAAYRNLLTAIPLEVQAEIRENQRAWLHNRLSVCNPVDKGYFTNCLREAEDSRTTALRGMLQHHIGITFVWRSIYFTAPGSPELAQMMKERGAETTGYVNASWPQAQSTAPEWAAWNKAIADAAGPENSFNYNDSTTTKWSKKDAIDNDVDVWVTLSSVSNRLVSAAVHGMTYGHGAAHPNHGTTQFNWMLKEQRVLAPGDVFSPQSDWKQELYARTDKFLHSQLDTEPGSNYQTWLDKPDEIKKTVQSIGTDPARWQIDSKGITIVFNPYEVACYACTPEPFTMSWESLKPLMNPAFQIPTASR